MLKRAMIVLPSDKYLALVSFDDESTLVAKTQSSCLIIQFLSEAIMSGIDNYNGMIFLQCIS